MAVQSEVIDVGGTLVFPTTPQFRGTFNGNVAVANLHASATVELSFDGVNVHGTMFAGTVSAGLAYNEDNYKDIWFRTVGVSPVYVEVILETSRI